METSILKTVKKILGLDENYTVFDLDVITHINTTFFTLQQLGIGPEQGYMIIDESQNWDAFIGDDPRLNAVKTYVFMRVRVLFDPPQNAFLVNSLNEQIKELEWRLNVHFERTGWRDPETYEPTPTHPDDDWVIDGGSP